MADASYYDVIIIGSGLTPLLTRLAQYLYPFINRSRGNLFCVCMRSFRENPYPTLKKGFRELP